MSFKTTWPTQRYLIEFTLLKDGSWWPGAESTKAGDAQSPIGF